MPAVHLAAAAVRAVRAAVRAAVSLACASLATAAAAEPPRAHDYPTAERVSFVELCMHDHPGGHYEMLNKCSCVIDAISREVTYDDYVTMSTALNANSIGGERGGAIRDAPAMQEQIRRFRKLVGEANTSCMIAPPPAR